MVSDVVVRDPSQYSASTHFVQRVKEGKRGIDGDVINECITEGEASFNKRTENVEYRASVDGVNYCLVADPETKLVCTAFPEDD